MVDFDNEATISTPAAEIVKILLLQARQNLFEAWEEYYKKMEYGTDVGLAVVKARLFSLWLEMQATLKRRLTEKEYNHIYRNALSDKQSEVLSAILRLNEILDELQVTRLDSKRVYNRQNVEEENVEFGL